MVTDFCKDKALFYYTGQTAQLVCAQEKELQNLAS